MNAMKADDQSLKQNNDQQFLRKNKHSAYYQQIRLHLTHFQVFYLPEVLNLFK